jgi:hypothetical protein
MRQRDPTIRRLLECHAAIRWQVLNNHSQEGRVDVLAAHREIPGGPYNGQREEP